MSCFVEKLFPRGGPDCVGVAEGDKRYPNNPLAAYGRPDGVRATQRLRHKRMVFNRAGLCDDLTIRPIHNKVKIFLRMRGGAGI